jgi:hypothetical protein
MRSPPYERRKLAFRRREATDQTGADDWTAPCVARAAVVFEDFLQRSKITQEQSTFEAREARVITQALPPGGPSYRRKTRIIGLTLFIGLAVGIGGAIAKEKLNAGFTTTYQVEEMLELPILPSVPSMDDLTVGGKVIQLPVYPKSMPLSRFSEALRALRSG